MNPKKIRNQKLEISFADKDFEKINKTLSKIHYIISDKKMDGCASATIFEILDNSNLDDDEKITEINNISYRLALICEHYLKALTIQNMHFDEVRDESEEELKKIFSDKRKDGGIASFSHYIDKLIVDNKYITAKAKYNIIMLLARFLNDEELTNYLNELKVVLNNVVVSYNDKREEKEKLGEYLDEYKHIISVYRRIYINIKDALKNNSESFIKARYGMFTDYVANIDFLYNLAHVLQLLINTEIKQCLFISSMERHVFYDINTDLIITFMNNDTATIHISNDTDVQKCYDDLIYDRLSECIDSSVPDNILSATEKEIQYTENGTIKYLYYNDLIESYSVSKEKQSK